MYGELLQYLKSDKPAVRDEAVNITLGLVSATTELEEGFKTLLPDFVRTLWRINTCCSEGHENALSALINLSDHAAAVFTSSSMIAAICEELEDKHVVGPVAIERLLYMLLVNVSRDRSGVLCLLEQELFLWRIFGYFADSGRRTANASAREAGNYIGNIFVNITAHPEGRQWFIKLDPSFWAIMRSQCCMEERGVIIASVIKNVCCDEQLLGNAAEFDFKEVMRLLACVVYPDEASRESFTKNNIVPEWREVDLSIRSHAIGPVRSLGVRKLVLECFVGLLRDPTLRELARDLNIYEVFRVWHLAESSDELKEAIEDIVHLVHYSESELQQPPAIPDGVF